MKKLTATLAIAIFFALSITAFADGGIPIGGRNCPPEEPNCTPLVEPEQQPLPEIKTMILREVIRLMRTIV